MNIGKWWQIVNVAYTVNIDDASMRVLGGTLGNTLSNFQCTFRQLLVVWLLQRHKAPKWSMGVAKSSLPNFKSLIHKHNTS